MGTRGAVAPLTWNESFNVTSAWLMKMKRMEPKSKPRETATPSRCVASISKTEYFQQALLRSLSVAAVIGIVSLPAFHKTQAARSSLDPNSGNGGKAPWGKTAGPPGIEVKVIYRMNNIVYAGTETLGVYRSTDNGLNWVAANQGIERTSVHDIIASGGNLLAATAASNCPTSLNVFKS